MTNPGWQTHWHKHPAVRSGDQLTRGERAADHSPGAGSGALPEGQPPPE